ncbi:hypothetical protein ACQ4PT_003494 [Festuca glaucescens]
MSVEEEARAANAQFWQVSSRQEEVEVEAEPEEVPAARRMSEAREEDEPATIDGGDHTAGDETTEDDGSVNPATEKKKERKDRKPTVLANTTDEITKETIMSKEHALVLCPEDGGSGLENHGSGLENHDSGMASQDTNDDSEPLVEPFGQRAVQLLAICANFPICKIFGYDWQHTRCIYVQRQGEVQEEGMVDLVPIGPREILMAYGYFGLKVYTNNESGPPITEAWDAYDDDEIEEYTQTICAGPGRKLEITYLVIPYAIEAKVEVKLKLKDLDSGSRAVYGKIKASTTDYRNKSVHLFSCERGMSLSFPSASTSILPLSPSMVAVPCHWQLELHVEVDLTVITCDSQEEQDKN